MKRSIVSAWILSLAAGTAMLQTACTSEQLVSFGTQVLGGFLNSYLSALGSGGTPAV